MDGVVLITGVSAAGKSTVAQLLAERLPRAVHIRGDIYRKAVVSGRVEMSPDAGPEALEQLRLRYRLSAMVADEYAAAGFTAVVQDVVIGKVLSEYVELVRTRPFRVVVLNPSPEAIAEREAGRAKTAYSDGGWSVAQLHDLFLRETPRLGLWLDTSAQTPEQTVTEVLARADEAIVRE